VKIGKVTIAANTSVEVVAAIGQTLAQSNTVLIYDPAESNLLLADAAGTPPTDPEVAIPIPSFPYKVDSTFEGCFVFNPNTKSVDVLVMAWKR
jgi:hypothetical protein